MIESRRAQCPHCHHSVRVIDGEFAPHGMTQIVFIGMTARPCPGSGKPVQHNQQGESH